MKRLFSIIFSLIFLSSVVGKANAVSREDLKLYNSLLEKEKEIVREYSGFMFNVLMINKIPIINVSYTQFVLSDNDKVSDDQPKVVNLLMANSHATHLDRQVFKQKLDELKGETPANIVRVKEFKDDDLNLIQFDALNTGGKLIYSEFLDAETGFNVKKVIFDKSGNILSVLFIYKLKINKKPRLLKVEDLKMIFVEQFINKNQIFDNVDNIEEFSEKVFNEVFDEAFESQ